MPTPSRQELDDALGGVIHAATNLFVQMKLAGCPDEDIAGALEEAKRKVAGYGSAWGFTPDEILGYGRQLDIGTAMFEEALAEEARRCR